MYKCNNEAAFTLNAIFLFSSRNYVENDHIILSAGVLGKNSIPGPWSVYQHDSHILLCRVSFKFCIICLLEYMEGGNMLKKRVGVRFVNWFEICLNLKLLYNFFQKKKKNFHIIKNDRITQVIRIYRVMTLTRSSIVNTDMTLLDYKFIEKNYIPY